MARRAATRGARWLTGSPAHGRGGVPGVWEGSFLAQLGEAETCAERIFSTVSLRARFHQKLARREVFRKASLRACRAQSASSQTLRAETCAKWPIMATLGGLECQFAHVTSQNLHEMASFATTARREVRDKASPRTRFHQKLARRETFRKVSLHTGFVFARLCQKGTFPHAPRLSPSPSPPYAIPPPRPHTTHKTSMPVRGHVATPVRFSFRLVFRREAIHDGNPWPS